MAKQPWLTKEAYLKAKEAVSKWPQWKIDAYNEMVDRKPALKELLEDDEPCRKK